MEFAIGFVVLAAVVVGVALLQNRRDDVAEGRDPQSEIEERLLQMMAKHPTSSDDEIATFVRDDLINARQASGARMKWATADTVARLRRTITRAKGSEPTGQPKLSGVHQPKPSPYDEKTGDELKHPYDEQSWEKTRK